MNRRKQFRAVATRYDKLAVRYQAAVTVADIFIWLRARPRPTPAMIQVTRGLWQEVRCRYAARRRRVTRPDSLGDHPRVTVPPRPRIGPGPPR